MGKAELIGSGLFAVLLGLPLAWGPGTPAPSHAAPPHRSKPQVARDLRQIRKDTLRVLVLSDPLTWEQRPGAMTGLEWELLERFAKRQRLRVKAVPVASRDSMLLMLQEGHGDVIAAQLSATGWAAPYTQHSQPYRLVAGMQARPRHAPVVGGRDSPPVDSLRVSAWSPFLDSLRHGTAIDSGIVLHIVDRRPEDLLAEAALGKVPALLVSDATADLEAKRLPLVEFGTRVGTSVPLVFAVRTNADHLLHALDTWLAVATEREARKAIITAYANGLDTRGPMRSFSALAFGGDTVSPYDSLFQVHADSLTWDWRLLAAVAFKESRFDTTAISYAGAGGLMQMMPATALRMGVTAEGGLNGHIEGASRYLDQLDRIWRKEVPDPAQRLKFVLAGYNAGPGHVKDAQRLAKELHLAPDRWDGNVERAIVLLNRPHYFTRSYIRTGYCRGQDTYWYVRDVVKMYAWLNGKQAH